MAQTAYKHEEMEHGVHESLFVETVEYGTCNIRHTFTYEPHHGGRRHGVDEWLEGYKHA